MTNESQMQWELDTTVRTGLFVPTTSDLQTAIGAARTVYYCPASSGVIGGISFELYMLIENTVKNTRLAQYLHTSYIMATKNDPKTSPTFQASLLMTPAYKLDPTELYIQITDANHLSYKHPAFERAEYKDPETKKPLRTTRIVRLTVYSHHLFAYLVNRFSEKSELTITIYPERQEPRYPSSELSEVIHPSRDAVETPVQGNAEPVPQRHWMVLLYMYHPPPSKPGRKTTKKESGKKKPLKFTHHLKPVGQVSAELLLVEQLKHVIIDDFKILYERDKIALVAAEKKKLQLQLQQMQQPNSLESATGPFLTLPSSATEIAPLQPKEKGTCLVANIPPLRAEMISGRVIPGDFYRASTVTELELRGLWDTRPPLVEEEHSHVGCVSWLAFIQDIRLERSFVSRGIKRQREPVVVPPTESVLDTTPVEVKTEKIEEEFLESLFAF